MAQELLVVLNRRDSDGFGFSVLGKPGFPPVIYDIVENSPAAESGKVEAGDVILQVNETDVIRCNTKEVLKCLRLSKDPVSLKLKRDPEIKERIFGFLSSTMNSENANPAEEDTFREKSIDNLTGTPPATGAAKRGYELRKSKSKDSVPSSDPFIFPLHGINNGNGNYASGKDHSQQTAGGPTQPPKFEAYMMTGDRVLKLTKNQQMSLLPKHQKKIDSLKQRYHLKEVSNRHATAVNNHRSSNNQNYVCKSVPSSPVEVESPDELKSSSTGTSPIPVHRASPLSSQNNEDEENHGDSPYGMQTSRSDDHIQFKKGTSVSTASVQLDEDITSSLNTLLDTKEEGEVNRANNSSGRRMEDQRILWTYNAPHAAIDNSTSTNTSEEDSQPSPRSVTSVSSSVMSSISSSDRKRPQPPTASSATNSFDLSQLEGLSSPDYNEEYCEILNQHDMNMEVTDPSDSDSTILVSEPKIRRIQRSIGVGNSSSELSQNHRIVIQVKGMEKESSKSYTAPYNSSNSNNYNNQSSRRAGSAVARYSSLNEEEEYGDGNQSDPKKAGYEALSEYDDELIAITEGAVNLAKAVSPPHSGSSEDESSDVESLRSFHYSPKAVDYPSASRLAKRLYLLDGFKKSDVSRHLSKNNDFNRAVAEEYLKHFDFTSDSLDGALRKFLSKFNLIGETQERERVLIHFSKRYLDCNPNSFNSQDAVHTLTCAIILLNTDLHGQITGRKMTCNAFIKNLHGLNDDEGDFPEEVLKSIYHSIKSSPLEWAVDTEAESSNTNGTPEDRLDPYYDRNACSLFKEMGTRKDLENHDQAARTLIDYKKGYVMRKCCIEPNGKRTPLGKRGWKMYYCTLRELVLYLHKDEHGFRKNQFSDNAHNAIRLHHALATKASDYTKKLHVFRLETADRAEYLFQTSDSKELQSWIDTINLVCASFSAPALSEPVGSQKKFQRPLLPSAPSKLNLREQLKEHERMVEKLQDEIVGHLAHAPERNSKALVVHNYKEKDAYLCYELKRYKTYLYLLRSRLPQLQDSKSVYPVPLADIDSEEESTAADEENDEVPPVNNRW